jgi:galactokinase
LTKRDGYAIEDIAAALGLDVGETKKRYMSQFPVRADTFQLYRRARHVFSESLRVTEFQQLCARVAGLLLFVDI